MKNRMMQNQFLKTLKHTKMKISKPELMAPAGDWISLRTAIDSGCDSVYFGIKGLNMRAGAENFSKDDMIKIVKQCHDNNVKAYLALNTIVYEDELHIVKRIITEAKKAKVDAVICWDFSIIQEAKKQGIPVFLSTQMSVSNSESVKFFRSLGVKRIVPARECSLEDIKKIKSAINDIEIEVFVHGAMCVSVSGRCFLSQFQFGRSANRGKCLQPCRREYKITDREEKHSFKLGNDYILSPRDLCTLPFIEKLIESGIDSFKIEGRNRSPEYVKTVTSVYRKAIDSCFDDRDNFEKLKKKLLIELKKVYNRGFSAGFFLGKPINEWTDRYGSKATTRKEYAGIVRNYYQKQGAAEIKVESNEFAEGDEIMFQGPTTGVFSQKAESIEINHKKVDKAEKGKSVALKTVEKVRENDKVYVILSSSNEA